MTHNHKSTVIPKLFGIAALALMLTAAGCSVQKNPQAAQQSQPQAAQSAAEDTAKQPETVQADLVIPTADVTETVKFYPVTVDDTQMEVLAVKASDGTIRTAFNTCQICYDSGRGYYRQTGKELQCQNCGNRFSMDEVEVQAGGCNPWPIFDESKVVSGAEITIPLDFLRESAKIFENWKTA